MWYSFTSRRPSTACGSAGRVTHREHRLARPHVVLGVPVAVEAPLHLQAARLEHARHLIDAAVAGLAPHPLLDVDGVVELHEVGQVVHAGPLQRLPGAEARSHGLEEGAGRPDLRVAVHAGLRGRHVGERRGLDRRVAVPAVDAQPAHVVRVRELDRLRDVRVGAGGPVGPHDDGRRGPEQGGQCADHDEARPGDLVRTGTEDLAHTLNTVGACPDGTTGRTTSAGPGETPRAAPDRCSLHGHSIASLTPQRATRPQRTRAICVDAGTLVPPPMSCRPSSSIVSQFTSVLSRKRDPAPRLGREPARRARESTMVRPHSAVRRHDWPPPRCESTRAGPRSHRSLGCMKPAAS